MAFVLIQHLSPDHKSMLAELLGRTTRMDVIEAIDGVEVKPNCVVVIPPDPTLPITGGRLTIIKPPPPRDPRRPADPLSLPGARPASKAVRLPEEINGIRAGREGTLYCARED